MSHSPLSFAVLSDLHFMAWKETLAPVEWVPQLQQAIADVVSLRPHFIVFNGDLTNGKLRDYELALKTIQSACDMPVYFTMGNHEYYGYYEQDDYAPEAFSVARAQERFLKFTGLTEIYYERRHGGYTFLFLSCERYTPELKDAGWLSQEQLHWFAERLMAAPPGPVFVFFHQPVNDTVADSRHTCVQSDELRAILRQREDTLFFSGHTHCRMDRPDQFVIQDGTVFVGGGCPHGENPQYRWVDVYTDRIVLRLRHPMEARWNDAYEYVLPMPHVSRR
jgi:Icc protein